MESFGVSIGQYVVKNVGVLCSPLAAAWKNNYLPEFGTKGHMVGLLRLAGMISGETHTEAYREVREKVY